MAKPFLSIEGQIERLKDRNMSFNNVNNAKHFLANISYYRLQGYWWEMQDDFVNHHFRDGSLFEDAVELYNFDRHLRLIIFNAIERIEIALRTKLIYHMSKSYGAFWHYDIVHFEEPKKHLIFLSKLNNDISSSSEEFIVKHFNNHPQELPECWKSLELPTLGSLSKLYQNLRHQLPEKNIIAREFGLLNQKHLASWLLTITFIRNVIAHHGRLWNRVIINKYGWPTSTPYELLSFVPNNEERRKLFPILTAILYMNNQISPGHHLKKELLDLFKQYPIADLYKMGFPEDWQEEIIWK